MITLYSNFDHDQAGFNTWEGGEWNGVEGGYPTSITRSTEQARTGTHSAKFVVNKTDPFSAGSIRAELTDWWGRDLTPVAEHWYGFSIFLPSSYIADPCEELVFQWHANGTTASGDGASMNNPAMGMHTVNGRWSFYQKYGGKFDLGAYETNKWTDWVIHVRFSPTGAASEKGLIEIWKNGVLVHTYIGRNTYNDKEGNYFKLGIYKYGWPDGYPTTTTTRTLYFDNVRIGNATASYQEVTPFTMATSTEPNINVTYSTAGTKTAILEVTANGLTHETIVRQVVQPNPTPTPIANPYPPDTTYTNLGTLPALARPNHLQEVKETVVYNDGVDPAVRTISRISDPVVFNTTTPSLLVHHYSKTRAWNCDQSMMIVGRHILEGGIDTTHKPLINLVNTVGVNHQWSFVDPNLCYYIDNNRLYKFVVNAGKTAVTRTMLYDFKVKHGFAWVQLGPSEGQIARNDTTVALNIENDGAGGKRIIVFDIKTLTITANKTHAAMGLVSDGSWRTDRPNVNFATITPSGNFVVCRIEDANGSHLLFDKNLNYIRNIGARLSHMDFGYDQAGNEVAVYKLPLAYQKLANNPSSTQVVLATQAQQEANNGGVVGSNNGTGGHASVAWKRDGWMYVSFNSYRKEILAFKLDTSGTVERFCFARDTNSPVVEVQGCPSPDGKMVAFKARWNGDANILTYLVKRKN